MNHDASSIEVSEPALACLRKLSKGGRHRIADESLAQLLNTAGLIRKDFWDGWRITRLGRQVAMARGIMPQPKKRGRLRNALDELIPESIDIMIVAQFMGVCGKALVHVFSLVLHAW
jgi:hypothetical protein